MIQPVPNAYGHGLQLNSAQAAANSEESSFRNWLVRRDVARQQIRRLSRRELQVVQLVSNGLANKSIALELEISVKTIETYRAQIMEKLNLYSVAELTKYAIREGLTSLES